MIYPQYFMMTMPNHADLARNGADRGVEAMKKLLVALILFAVGGVRLRISRTLCG